MDVIAARRRLLMRPQASLAVGIFTRGYEAILTPEATTSFTITHNLGMVPRLCIIKLDDSTRQQTNAYVIYGIIDFNVAGLPKDILGFGAFEFYYGDYSSASIAYPNSDTRKKLLADSSTIEIGSPYGTFRSCWDINADYHVQVLG